VVWPVDEYAGGCRCYNQAGGCSLQRLLSRGVLGLGLIKIRPAVELIGGVRVVVGVGVGVRGVVGDDLLASLACYESFRMGPASIAEAKWEVLVVWGINTRWLSSRLACGDPWGCRVPVRSRSGLEVGVLVVKGNLAKFAVRLPVITSGSVTSPVLGLGVMVRWRWNDPAPSALQIQDPKTKVSPRLKATHGLMKIEAVKFAMRSSARAPTWSTSCQCFRPATYQGEYPR
jgi:hypothetical protein